MPNVNILVGTMYGGALDVAEQVKPLFEEVGYTVSMLQIKAGYRQIAVDYDGSDLEVDADFSGPFAGLHVAF